MFHWSIDFQTFSTIFTSEPLLEELLISGNIILHPMALYLISVIDSGSEGIYNQCITFIVLSNSPQEATTIVQISAIFCLYYKPDTVGIFIIIGSSQFYKYAVLLLCDLLLLLFLK